MKLIARNWSVGGVFLAALTATACGGDDSNGKKGGDSDSGPSAGGGGNEVDAGAGGKVNAPDAKAEAGATGTGCEPDETVPVPTDRCSPTKDDPSGLPQCFAWQKVEPPDAECSDGSPYKFFVAYSNTSNNVVISFEPGGACWDYESCSGAVGIRGAANPHGIPDSHMSTYGNLNHLAYNDQNPIKDWNKVFVSYCTGDLHTGNNEIVYDNPNPVPADAGPPDASTPPASITFRHHGHGNTMAVIDWVKAHFKNVPKLLVTGCSAGGAASLINYHFIRAGMGDQAQCGYLLDDSGPIFHSDGPSKELHAKVRSSWNVDPILDSLEGKVPVPIADIKEDFGLMNVALAKEYPKDRLALTAYRMDLNYSVYSYQRFFPGSTEQEIHDFWWSDMQKLMKTFDEYPNMGYFLPYFRNDNCSHCVSIPPLAHIDKLLTDTWFGTDIQAQAINLRQYTVDLLDDKKPMKSYVEELQSSEMFTPSESTSCLEGGTLN